MGNIQIFQFINMKFSTFLAIAAFLVTSNDAIKVVQKNVEDDKPPPTAADTPTSGYYGADEDDVMNNIFNHYAVSITNAAGSTTGQKVLYKDGCQKAAAEILLVTK